MKIRLSRDNFIKQFPELRKEILACFEQDYFLIEGEFVDGVHPLIHKYPGLIDHFTVSEMSILKEMYGKRLTPRDQLRYLFHSVEDPTMMCQSNVLDVHVKNIRMKLSKFELPLQIKTYRSMGYELIEK